MQPTLSQPARYSIRAYGTLDPSWSERLGGLSIAASREEDGTTYVTLVGELADQAALMGVLLLLNRLGFPIVQVECQWAVLDD